MRDPDDLSMAAMGRLLNHGLDGDIEVAEHIGVSVRTVDGDWAHARAWLKRELAHQPAGDEPEKREESN